MTLKEADELLPNGFHDAEIEQFSFNPREEVLTIDVDVWVGTMDEPPSLRERYRRGQIRFSGVDFFALPVPRAKPLDWTILALNQTAYEPFETSYAAQREREKRLLAFDIAFGYSELSIAAEAFDFVWSTEDEVNRDPDDESGLMQTR